MGNKFTKMLKIFDKIDEMKKPEGYLRDRNNWCPCS